MDIKDMVPNVNISFNDILAKAMKAPLVKINRAKFLKRELLKYCSEDVIEEAIKKNPAKAGVSKEIVNKVSISVINYETSKVTALSVAAGVPGGPVAVAAAIGDITSYFVFVLRVLQELAYLYGFGQFDFDDNDDDMDSETMNITLVFMGVMFGVQGAGSLLHKLAEIVAKNVSKKLAQKALTKGTIYPLIKKIATKVGMKITKQIFADSVAGVVPVIGGVVSGGLTLAMFRPGCMKLRKQLMSFDLCDPNYYKDAQAPCNGPDEKDKNNTVIDVDFTVIDKDDTEDSTGSENSDGPDDSDDPENSNGSGDDS